MSVSVHVPCVGVCVCPRDWLLVAGVGQRGPSGVAVFTALRSRPYPPSAPSLGGAAGPSSANLSWPVPLVLDGVSITGYSVELATVGEGCHSARSWRYERQQQLR